MAVDHRAPSPCEPLEIERGQPELDVGVAGDFAKFDQALAAEPVGFLHGSEREGIVSRRPIRDERRFDGGLAEIAQSASQIAEHRRIEDGANGQIAIEARADLGSQASGQQRVAAEMEKVIGQANTLEAQQLRHEFAEQNLLGCARRNVASRQARALGRRQRPAIQLAVGRQRQRIEHHERRGHHVLRQAHSQVLAQFSKIDGRRLALLILASHQVSDQALVASRVLACDHGCLSDLRLAQQSGFDLARLDAEAANLDLLIGASVEEQVAVVAPGRQVAGRGRAARRDRLRRDWRVKRSAVSAGRFQ